MYALPFKNYLKRDGKPIMLVNICHLLPAPTNIRTDQQQSNKRLSLSTTLTLTLTTLANT